MKKSNFRAAPALGFLAGIAAAVGVAPNAMAAYADWTVSNGTSGSGTLGGTGGVPDFSFALSGALTPGDTEIDANDPFTNAAWESRFGDGDGRESLRFGSDSDDGTMESTIVLSFAQAVPANRMAFAVTDLEGEDAIISASLNGTAVSAASIENWFVELFDSNPGGQNDLPSAFDAANSAVVAQYDPDGKLSSEVLDVMSGTESASAWFSPDVPIDTLTITHRNRYGGQASMHVYVAADVPEPGTAMALLAIGLIGLRRVRPSRVAHP